jgi:predicted DNA-binding protein
MSEYIGYVWEQLYGATSSLASSPLALRERLLDAVVSRVFKLFHPTKEEKLPPEISQRLDSLEQKLTKHGSIEETIKRMEDREVEEAIEEIIALFSMVARAYPEKKVNSR